MCVCVCVCVWGGRGGGGICSSSHRNNHYSLQVNDDCARGYGMMYSITHYHMTSCDTTASCDVT